MKRVTHLISPHPLISYEQIAGGNHPLNTIFQINRFSYEVRKKVGKLITGDKIKRTIHGVIMRSLWEDLK